MKVSNNYTQAEAEEIVRESDKQRRRDERTIKVTAQQERYYDPYACLYKEDEPTPAFIVIYQDYHMVPGRSINPRANDRDAPPDRVPHWAVYTFACESDLLAWEKNEIQEPGALRRPNHRIFAVSGEVTTEVTTTLKVVNQNDQNSND